MATSAGRESQHQQTAHWHCDPLQKNHDFGVCETLQKSICETLRKFAKVCENKNCKTITKCCKEVRNHICETLQNIAKDYEINMQKLAKPKYFCEGIFANACKIICISLSRILAKTQFAKTNLQNLAKNVTVLIACSTPPPPLLRPGPLLHPPPQPGHPQRLHTLHHHYPKTHCKRHIALLCLPQMLHNPGIPTNLW